MKEERSPCLQCERKDKNKNECVDACDDLDRYQDGLPYLSLWREDPECYDIPGLERSRAYPAVE